MAASYPGAVKTFTTKSAGQTIQPADVNDLQDEVNAIESGLLNGTAPVTSSNATVNALQVSSGSTFAVRPVMPPPDIAVVFRASTVTIGSSGASTLTWDAQSIATNSSLHSTATNPDRLTPQSTGVYFFAAGVRVNAPALASTGTMQINIRDSSGGEIGRFLTDITAQGTILQVCGYKRFDVVGGYAVCVLGMTGQSAVSVSSGVGETWFSIRKL